MVKENLDFQINFFERLLEKKSDFAEALAALGEAYTRKGMYDKGLETDMKLVSLKPRDPIARYNLACDYSLLRQADLAIRNLREAIELGYREFDFMEKDEDLEYVRKDRRYRRLIDRYIRKRPSARRQSKHKI